MRAWASLREVVSKLREVCAGQRRSLVQKVAILDSHVDMVKGKPPGVHASVAADPFGPVYPSGVAENSREVHLLSVASSSHGFSLRSSCELVFLLDRGGKPRQQPQVVCKMRLDLIMPLADPAGRYYAAHRQMLRDCHPSVVLPAPTLQTGGLGDVHPVGKAPWGFRGSAALAGLFRGPAAVGFSVKALVRRQRPRKLAQTGLKAIQGLRDPLTVQRALLQVHQVRKILDYV
jgi:hypothetical protein